VFYCQLATSSSIAQADLDFWLDAFADSYESNFLPDIGTGLTTTLAKAVLFTPGGGQLSSSEARTGTGSGGTVVANDATCSVISWLTAVYWRGGKPRTYLPAPGEGMITAGNSLTAGQITALQADAAAFLTAINALTHGTITSTAFGFVSFRSGNAERSPSIFFPVTGARVHARLGTQRRRLGRWIP